MSSFNKASKVNQKVHRERHQPESRAHLGLLEKKKDYRFRADDFNSKKKILKKLKNATLDRNPDEFYFHMINSEVKDGVHHEKPTKPDRSEVEQKKVIENKTLPYVAMKRTIEAKKVEKLTSELHLVDMADNFGNTHIRFDEDSETSCPGRRSGPALGLNNSSLNDFQLNKLMEKKAARYRELARRIERKNKLTTIQEKMEIQHALATDKSTERPKLIQPATKTTAAVYKWKYERKR